MEDRCNVIIDNAVDDGRALYYWQRQNHYTIIPKFHVIKSRLYDKKENDTNLKHEDAKHFKTQLWIKTSRTINTLYLMMPSDGYMEQQTKQSLVQIMAHRQTITWIKSDLLSINRTYFKEILFVIQKFSLKKYFPFLETYSDLW